MVTGSPRGASAMSDAIAARNATASGCKEASVPSDSLHTHEHRAWINPQRAGSETSGLGRYGGAAAKGRQWSAMPRAAHNVCLKEDVTRCNFSDRLAACIDPSSETTRG